MDLVEDQVVEEVRDLASGEPLLPGHTWAGVEAGCLAASIPALLQFLAIRQFHPMQLK